MTNQFIKKVCERSSMRNGALVALYFNDNLGYVELEELTGWKADSISRTLRRCADQEYLHIGRSDGKVCLKLLPKGRQIAEQIIGEEKKLDEITEKQKLIREEEFDWKEKLEKYILSQEKEIIKLRSKDRNVWRISFKDIIRFDPELGDILLDKPTEFLGFGRFIIKRIFETEPFIKIGNLPDIEELGINDINIKCLSHMKCFKGNVKYLSENSPFISEARWECPSCGNVVLLAIEDDLIESPRKCACGRRGKFKKTWEREENRYYFLLEENVDSIKSGLQPKTVMVMVENELCHDKIFRKIQAGSRIKVTGILSKKYKYKYGKQQAHFSFIVKASDIEVAEDDFVDLKMTSEDEVKISEIIHLMKDSFEKGFYKLNRNFCPQILGENLAKEALQCQLVSGGNTLDSNGMIIKNLINIALIGDPGSGKSELGLYTSLMLPNSRYAVGTSSTGIGITASIRKDPDIGAFVVEAGKVVLANGAVCVIDEFDKMHEEDMNRLLECMEHGKISIDKAGLSRTLVAETAVLALANPIGGVLDLQSPILKQFKLSPPVRQRFDLIKIMKDESNEEEDRRASTHMNLRVTPEGIQADYDINFMRKFYNYVKHLPEPILSEEARDLITEYFVKLRKEAKRNNTHSVVGKRINRTYQNLARCYAKFRGAVSVERRDVERVHHLLMQTLAEWAITQDGSIDTSALYSDVSIADSGKYNHMRRIIETLRQAYFNQPISEEVILSELGKHYNPVEIEEFLAKEQKHGFITAHVKQGHYLIL